MRLRSIAFVFVFAAAAPAQDWPQWRGPNRDAKVVGFTAPAAWPKTLTKKWSVKVGVGESSPVLVGDKLFVFARDGGDEVTMALDAGSGKTIWSEKYPAAAITNAAAPHPGPRSTPAVGAGKICTLGVHGVVTCRDADTGKLVWTKTHNAKPNFPKFFTSSSPIIADGKCIVFEDALTAYDLANGDTAWRWAGQPAPYGSPILMTVDGVQQIVTPFEGGIAGIRATDGALLWKVAAPVSGYASTYCTPVADGSTVIYSYSGGKKAGTKTIAYKIEKKGDAFAATEQWKQNYGAAGYYTPVLKDGLLFAATPGFNFFCADAKTGAQLWTDATKRGQCGCILDAGAVLLSLTSDKHLVAFKSTGKAFEEVANYTVADSETWSVPIIAGNRVFVKDKAGALTLWTID